MTNLNSYEEIGFEVVYNLHPKFTVKSVGAGDYQGTKYKASLKIVTRNVFERLNQKTQAYDEIIEDLTFKIPCETDEQAGDLLDTFRQFRAKGEVLKLTGNLPNSNNEVLVLDNPTSFVIKEIKDNKDIKKGS